MYLAEMFVSDAYALTRILKPYSLPNAANKSLWKWVAISQFDFVTSKPDVRRVHWNLADERVDENGLAASTPNCRTGTWQSHVD